MGEETKNHRPSRKHHSPAHKKKLEQKKKPQPKGPSSQKPMARAPDAKPQAKGADALRGALRAGLVAPTKERSEEGEFEETERENPVFAALGMIENTHLGGEMVMDGASHGRTWGQLATNMAEEAAEIEEDGSFGQQAFQGSSPIFGALSILGGVSEIAEGVKNPNQADGDFQVVEGGLSVGSGVSNVAALMGKAGPLGPELEALSTGLKVGNYGDKQVKEMDWLHDRTGNAVTAKDWAVDKAEQFGDGVEQSTHSHILGRIAGANASIAYGIEGGAVAGAAAVNAKALALEDVGRGYGRHAANQARADQYGVQDIGYAVRDSKTGRVTLTQPGTDQSWQGAQQAADYDDKESDAVDRSKLLHPERWAEGPNYVSAFNQLSEEAYAATHKK